VTLFGISGETCSVNTFLLSAVVMLAIFMTSGVFVGVVRGAANVTDIVNANLAGLTADEEFIGERKAYQRMLTDAMSRGALTRSFAESLHLAYASVARGVKSGALGIIEQPAMYASKHGPVGLFKGIGKAMIGAVVKPVVGLGDGVVLVMNHMSDITSKQRVFPKIPKRLRRALPRRLAEKPNCVSLEPYDERAAKAQTIVTGGESVDDVYLGHVNVQSHLLIASEQCLWAIDRISREPWCVSWSEISHFRAIDGGVQISVFSQTGLKTYFFQVENQMQRLELQKLLSIQRLKMVSIVIQIFSLRKQNKVYLMCFKNCIDLGQSFRRKQLLYESKFRGFISTSGLWDKDSARFTYFWEFKQSSQASQWGERRN
jgi:hypothetical protein